jgi:hypothetical protein
MEWQGDAIQSLNEQWVMNNNDPLCHLNWTGIAVNSPCFASP